MEFRKEEWLGSWDNFENYLYSEEEKMLETWELVEEACKSAPGLASMFAGKAKDFWKRACVTQTLENPVMLGGINVTETENGIRICFLDREENKLGEYSYRLSEIVERGLEGKENLLLFAEDAPKDCPFRYVLSMEPMPSRVTRSKSDLLSHFHFQFGSSKEKLIAEGKLVQPGWYATMCQGDSTEQEKCNIVRALHRLQTE